MREKRESEKKQKREKENRRKTLRNEYFSSTNILDQKVMHEVNLSDSEIRKLKILSLRMLVTVKQDNTLKARLVARGFLQREGINLVRQISLK